MSSYYRLNLPITITITMAFPRAVESAQNIGLTYKSLIAKTDVGIIRDCIRGDIDVIDQKIITAFGLGGTSIIHELRSNYPVVNLSKADAQARVYSEIINIYIEDKGFENTRIEIGEPSKLHISWVNGMDDDEKKSRIAYMVQNSVKKTQVKSRW